jgi:uncharacterized protein (DUF433 family)
MTPFSRITQNPAVMGGKPCIRGMRVGASIDELLAEYPYIEREDVFEALRYAAWRA